MKRLKLAMNVEKTRRRRVPEESMTFLGYRIGCNYRLDTGAAYIGTRPSPESVQSICRRVSELTTPASRAPAAGGRGGTPQPVADRLGELLHHGTGQPAYEAIDRHATRRLHQWLCPKHKVRIWKHVRFPAERLWSDYRLTHLAPRTARFPWAKA